MGRRDRISRWVATPRLASLRNVARPSDRTVERAVRWLTLLAVAVANVIGAVAVFVLSVWALPTGDLEGEASPVVVNLALAAGYVLIIFPLGARWMLRRLLPGRQWLKDGRAPSEAEQRNLLRAPLQIMFVVGTGWMFAAIVFGVYNLTYSFELGQRVGVTVAMGGLVTCACAYLLSERLLRPAAARALSARPLDQPALPGVTTRAMFAWAIGSAVPLIGIGLISLSALTEKDFTRSELAVAALGLAAGALIIGFFFVLLTARATADPIVSVRQALSAIERGELEEEVPVYDGTEVGLLQSGFNRMAEGLREREQLRELFGMHVGEEVAREALESGTGLGGETRDVAVLFVDIIGSTTIATERSADKVVQLLNEFFGMVVEVVERHGGWVNKFEGDAALAIFGAPDPLEDSAGAALAAGRELSLELGSERLEAQAGIGVSFGEAVAGNIGSSHRYEYTVIGDAVNEAARLTELAKTRPGKLLGSGAAFDAAREAEREHWSFDEEVTLRGRGEASRLYVWVDGDARPAAARRDEGSTAA